VWGKQTRPSNPRSSSSTGWRNVAPNLNSSKQQFQRIRCQIFRTRALAKEQFCSTHSPGFAWFTTLYCLWSLRRTSDPDDQGSKHVRVITWLSRWLPPTQTKTTCLSLSKLMFSGMCNIYTNRCRVQAHKSSSETINPDSNRKGQGQYAEGCHPTAYQRQQRQDAQFIQTLLMQQGR